MGKPRVSWRGRRSAQVEQPTATPVPVSPQLEQNLTRLLFALQDAELLAVIASACCGGARPREMAELNKLAGSLTYRRERTAALLERLHAAAEVRHG